MKISLKQCLILITAAIILLFTLSTCSFPANVYLSINWSYDTDIPDVSFTCGAPNIPTVFTDIAKGKYYYTVPGSYNISYSYSSGPAYSLNFTIAKDYTVLGQENAYYDIIIHENFDPEFYKVPQAF